MRIEGLKTDGSTRALVTIDFPHHEIHDGELYEVVHYDATLANSAAISIATTAAIGYKAHFTFEGTCGGDATIELLEGGTVTGGDAATCWNMNRNYGDITGLAVTDATLGGTPSTLVGLFLPGGKAGQASGSSGGSRIGLEWVTDPTKTYAVRVTNLSGLAKPASIVVNFYT